MNRLAMAGAVLAAVGLAGLAPADDKKDETGAKLVGKWEVTKAETDTPVGTVVEFTKDGKLVVLLKEDGKETKLEGTYKVEKDKLAVSITVEGQKYDDSLTVKKITADALELIDKDKKLEVLKKVEPPKKK